MSQYQLIAFDMDGTLLNSEKKISERTQKAIQRAYASGKYVALSTGRCLAELREFIEKMPALRYLICVSGGMVYDCHQNKLIYQNAIRPETIDRILEVARQEDTFLQFLTTESTVERHIIPIMDHFQLGVYRPMFEAVTTKVENIYEYFAAHRGPVEKINIYHTDTVCRERSRERLKSAPLVLTDSEITSLECTPPGTTKGKGLEMLCAHLGLDLSETIAVGDADNDIAILETAGLSVAMGNAKEHVKEICDVIVADNDHDGCAEAIDRFLLAKD